MQKPTSAFAKKTKRPAASGEKVAPTPAPKHAPAAHVDKHDAHPNAKHAQKK